LKGHTEGESSKQGATLQEQERKFFEKPEINTELSEYKEASKAYHNKVREFNNIMLEIEKKGDTMPQAHKENLLNESIKLRNAVDHYHDYIEHLKKELNIHSSDVSSSEYNSSEEFTSDNSSSEESRPSKRPRH